MNIAVLDDHVLIVMAEPGEPVSAADASCLRAKLADALPEWRPLVFAQGGTLVDLRGDAEATRLANELLARLIAGQQA